MLTPIRCPTCGLPIDEIASIYRVRASARARAERERLGLHAPASAFVAPAYASPVGDILDQLTVVFDCCRVHVFTAMNFSDYFTRPPTAGLVREATQGYEPETQTEQEPQPEQEAQ